MLRACCSGRTNFGVFLTKLLVCTEQAFIEILCRTGAPSKLILCLSLDGEYRIGDDLQSSDLGGGGVVMVDRLFPQSWVVFNSTFYKEFEVVSMCGA